MDDGAGIRNMVCAVLSILLAGVIVFMFCTENKKENARVAAVQAVVEEVPSYEKELQDLRSELSNLQDRISYSSEEAEIMVGFVASGVSDFDYIADTASAYHFFPVLIIDCTMEMDAIKDMIKTADESWEIMLYAPTFSEEINADILSVMACLENEGKEHTGVFFLRSDYSTDANIQMLKEDGFLGYTSYHSESPEAGQRENGVVYFDYSYLSTSGTSVVRRISAMYDNRASMIFALDMNSINNGALAEAYVTELFDTLQGYAEKENCSFSTMGNVISELSEVNSIEAVNQGSYKEQAAEIQAQINEMEERINELYNKLEN